MIKQFENYSEIAAICKKYAIKNWTPNPDGSIDVSGHVSIQDRNLTKLPLKFRLVSGTFYCSNNKLTTMVGSPKWVGGNFWCNDNNLTTLEGAPREVEGRFYFHNNNFPEYFYSFIVLNLYSSEIIIKQILKWQDDYELWKNPEMFEEKFKRMMEDIKEIDLPHIKIKFPNI